MATGDLKNNIKKLQSELKSISFSLPLDLFKYLKLIRINRGDPVQFLPILHYLLLDWNPKLTKYLFEKGFDFYGKDARFLSLVYSMLLHEFNYKPKLSEAQFFKIGFAEWKCLLIVDIVQLLKNLEKELKRNVSSVVAIQSQGSRPESNISARPVPIPQEKPVDLYCEDESLLEMASDVISFRVKRSPSPFSVHASPIRAERYTPMNDYDNSYTPKHDEYTPKHDSYTKQNGPSNLQIQILESHERMRELENEVDVAKQEREILRMELYDALERVREVQGRLERIEGVLQNNEHRDLLLPARDQSRDTAKDREQKDYRDQSFRSSHRSTHLKDQSSITGDVSILSFKSNSAQDRIKKMEQRIKDAKRLLGTL